VQPSDSRDRSKPLRAPLWAIASERERQRLATAERLGRAKVSPSAAPPAAQTRERLIARGLLRPRAGLRDGDPTPMAELPEPTLRLRPEDRELARRHVAQGPIPMWHPAAEELRPMRW
jgi:hypothetical protein